MSEQNPLLVQCFAAIFPKLPVDQIPNATTETVPEWDSLATVTLAALLEQEFGAPVDVFDLPELNSFSAVQDHLRKHLHSL